MTTPATCVHEDFSVLADVARLTDVEDGPVVGYSMDIRVECVACHEPFCFRGLPMGLSQLAPTGSLDGTVLTAPIHPMSDPTAGIGMLGFSVAVHGPGELSDRPGLPGVDTSDPDDHGRLGHHA